MECSECMDYIFFSAILFMSCLHGLLLAAIFFFNSRLNSKSNKFLALALLGICVILAYEFMYWLDLYKIIPNWIQLIPIYIRTTIPVGIYCFVTFLIQPNHRLTRIERLAIYAIFVEIFIETQNIVVHILFQDTQIIESLENWIMMINGFLSVIASVTLIPKALKKVNQYQKSLFDNYSTTEKRSLSWLQKFLWALLFMVGLWCISFTQYALDFWEDGDETFALVTIGLVILLFSIGYFMILEYKWFEIVPVKEDYESSKPTIQKLSSKTDLYHQNLIQLIQQNKLYEDVELTLDSLAQQLQISSGYLSQIINEKEQKNFFEFVNHYRVEAVKEKLLDEEFQHYTIMGIANECGFNSKSTFNSVFKKLTGQTPSAYRKLQVSS